MSTLLKALRQQSSETMSSSLAQQYAGADRQRQRSRGFWFLFSVVAIVSLAAAIWLRLSFSAATTTLANSNVGAAEWGKATNLTTTITLPLWSAKASPTATKASADEQPQQSASESKPKRQALDLTSVSPDLLKRFQAAVEQTANTDDNAENGSEKLSVIPALSELSESFQRQVPRFAYQAHMYSSQANKRWIRLSGARLQEGDQWRGMDVVAIRPNEVVLSLQQQAFTVEALTDWQG
ncbi:hypothetical protein CWI84_10750 [Idiomarina tyrosinivorans]|uniref:Type II secretion system protein GspB C-terminal domain-containing protein n=1 Tax=Idiomarina tyrosinivorans TaxID=1445662 RepID=A0A432ZJP8_9GAMM|nr:general secretion pathway protein GspB [Idiomarina tyrosinivorans]RUO78159.1 hypothetical protein CWI84_10750 [Idiomarina tyrosinivorans]